LERIIKVAPSAQNPTRACESPPCGGKRHWRFHPSGHYGPDGTDLTPRNPETFKRLAGGIGKVVRA
jgi:hypothetical protein